MKQKTILFALLLQFAATVVTAQLSFSNRPYSLQLYPRQSFDSSSVVIAGKVTMSGYSKIIYTVKKNNVLTDSAVANLSYSGGTASFTKTFKIHAEKSLYNFRLYLYNGVAGQVMNADSVSCGDIFIVTGQSNAVSLANITVSDTINTWVRSFGSNSPVYSECQGDTTWGLAIAGTGTHHAGIGVWAYRLGRQIADSCNIPVAFINGAKFGSRIIDHLPLVNHADLNSCYGKILYRTQKARITSSIKAIFWYQGESDADSSCFQYASRFNQLYIGWRQDYPALSKIFVMQIRPGCMTGATMNFHQQLREVLRTLPSLYSDVTLMTTTAIPDHDGCHFYVNGYYQLAQRLFDELGDDYYSRPSISASGPPRILKAFYSKSDNKEISILFDQPVIYPAVFNGYNIKDYLYLNSNITFTGGSASGDTIKLQLSASSNANKLSYLPAVYYNATSSTYEGPWLANNRNVGVPSFYQIPILNTLPVTGSLCSVGSVQLSTTRIAQSYQWYNNGTIISGANASSYTATVDGLYTLLMTDANGLTATSNPVKISGGRIVPIVTSSTGSSMFCNGSSVLLQSDISGNSYQWFKNGVAISNATSAAYAASSNGNYSVRVLEISGCYSTSSSVSVTTAANPAASFTISNQFDVCDDSLTTLTANIGTGYTYQWRRNNNNIPGAINRVYNTVNKGQYSVIVTNTLGCSKTTGNKTIPVTDPVATITASSTLICPGDTVFLTATAGVGYSYLWFKNYTAMQGTNQQVYNATVAATYGVRVTNSIGCSTNSSPKVINNKPVCNEWKRTLPFTDEDNGIIISPNPFHSSLVVHLPSTNSSENFELKIFNLQMQKVFSKGNLLPGEQFSIDQNSLPAGIYFYQLYSSSENYSGKLIKD